MTEMLMQQLKKSIFKVMGTMFDLAVEEMNFPVAVFFDSNKLKGCRIHFSGAYSGAVYMFAEPDVLLRMTKNITEENLEGVSEEYVVGTLKEAVNMIAGSALTEFDKQSYVNLGIPESLLPAFEFPSGDPVIYKTSHGYIACMMELDDSVS